jgi:hypothetical protein
MSEVVSNRLYVYKDDITDLDIISGTRKLSFNNAGIDDGLINSIMITRCHELIHCLYLLLTLHLQLAR